MLNITHYQRNANQISIDFFRILKVKKAWLQFWTDIVYKCVYAYICDVTVCMQLCVYAHICMAYVFVYSSVWMKVSCVHVHIYVSMYKCIPIFIWMCVKQVLVAQSCLTFYNPMDYSPPASFIYGIFQARILEWVPFPAPGDVPGPRIESASPVSLALQADSLPTKPLWMRVYVFIYASMYITCVSLC